MPRSKTYDAETDVHGGTCRQTRGDLEWLLDSLQSANVGDLRLLRATPERLRRKVEIKGHIGRGIGGWKSL